MLILKLINMRKIFIVLLSLSIGFVNAQTIDANTAAKTITAAGLKKHLSIIAGEEMQGRETGTEGERKAASYLVSQYKQMDLTPGNAGSYRMPFSLFQDKVTSSSLKVNGTSYTLDKDFWISAATAPQKLFTSAEVFYVGSEFNDKKLGAIGIINIAKTNPSMPSNLSGRMAFTANTNTFLSMTVSKTVGAALLGGTKEFSDQEWETLPVGKYTAAIEWLADKTSATVASANVIAYMPSKEKSDEYLFITSHYDHEGVKNGVIYYGADDDGSGTTGALAIAEAFAKARKKGFSPKRNIVFMNVSGEEKGLLGSKYYGDHPIFPMEKTTADLNIDMIGRIDPTYKGDSMNYVYVIGEDKLSSDLQPITDKVNKNYNMELDRRFNDPKDPNRFYYRSDHYNFAAKGVPVIFYFNGTHADYHKPTDRVEKINFDLMEKRTRIIFETAWDMATRENMLKRDMPLNMPATR